ncbi:hypothetical protein [Streptomyces sp. NPDC048282]
MAKDPDGFAFTDSRFGTAALPFQTSAPLGLRSRRPPRGLDKSFADD